MLGYEPSSMIGIASLSPKTPNALKLSKINASGLPERI
jgi:hypothetical protein